MKRILIMMLFIIVLTGCNDKAEEMDLDSLSLSEIVDRTINLDNVTIVYSYGANQEPTRVRTYSFDEEDIRLDEEDEDAIYYIVRNNEYAMVTQFLDHEILYARVYSSNDVFPTIEMLISFIVNLELIDLFTIEDNVYVYQSDLEEYEIEVSTDGYILRITRTFISNGDYGEIVLSDYNITEVNVPQYAFR